MSRTYVSEHMRKQIVEQLRKIEIEEQVTILYACESGSRAWGFPSQDSDYDVRFIYIRRVQDYLSIFEKRDVIERPINEQLDISGWDLKKALLLFRKSNPPLLEWLQSPVQYWNIGDFADQLRTLAQQHFAQKACMYHYLHMAQGNYREYLQGDEVRIKKYFYVLRPILACRWLEIDKTLPPIEFGQLAELLVQEERELGYTGLKEAVDTLLARKMAGEELDLELRIDVINEYLENRLTYLKNVAAALPRYAGAVDLDSQLDQLFYETITTIT